MKGDKLRASATLNPAPAESHAKRRSLTFEISRIERRLKSIYSQLGETTYGIILAGMAAGTLDPRVNELLIRVQFYLTELDKLRSQLFRT